MPKRTNEFQHLVAMIERVACPYGGRVDESRELPDSILGRGREVDIVIELSDPNHPVLIGVECTGGENPRPATVGWVERMYGKHQTLPTTSVILVAKGGFTASALKKAAHWNMQALTLSEAEDLDWEPVIRRLQQVQIVSFLRPYPTRVTLVLGLRPGEEALDPSLVDPATVILRHDDEETTWAPPEVVDHWLSDPAFLAEVEKLAYTDARTVIEFECPMKPGVYFIDRDGRKRSVVAIAVQAKCVREDSSIHLAQGTFGTYAYAHGRGSSFGRRLELVAVQRAGKQSQIGFEVETRTKGRGARSGQEQTEP